MEVRLFLISSASGHHFVLINFPFCRCQQCGGVVKNGSCMDRGCKRGATLHLEFLARASDGTGQVTLVIGPECVDKNSHWSLFHFEERFEFLSFCFCFDG